MLTIISISITVLIAIIGGIYAIVTNTKNFELSEQYKNELLTWYEKVIFVIAKVQGNCVKKERRSVVSVICFDRYWQILFS